MSEPLCSGCNRWVAPHLVTRDCDGCGEHVYVTVKTYEWSNAPTEHKVLLEHNGETLHLGADEAEKLIELLQAGIAEARRREAKE